MKRQAATAILILTALLAALTWARPHQFATGGKSSPAPIDKGAADTVETATFALG